MPLSVVKEKRLRNYNKNSQKATCVSESKNMRAECVLAWLCRFIFFPEYARSNAVCLTNTAALRSRYELFRHEASHYCVNLYNLPFGRPEHEFSPDCSHKAISNKDIYPVNVSTNKLYTVKCVRCPRRFQSITSLSDHVVRHDERFRLPEGAGRDWTSKNRWIYRQCPICYEFEVKKTTVKANESVKSLIGNLTMSAGTMCCYTCQNPVSRLKVLRKMKMRETGRKNDPIAPAYSLESAAGSELERSNSQRRSGEADDFKAQGESSCDGSQAHARRQRGVLKPVKNSASFGL